MYMNTRHFTINIIIISILVLYTSCKNDSIQSEKSIVKSNENWGFTRGFSSKIGAKVYSKQEATQWTMNKLNEKLKSKSTKQQTYSINATRDTTLVLQQGTKVKFKANSLVSKETGKPIKGHVKLIAKEYYRLSDCIRDGVSTQTANNSLESAGMVYLRAFSGDEECKLDKNQNILLTFSNHDYIEEMNIYFGNNNKSNIVSWELDSTSIKKRKVVKSIGGSIWLTQFTYSRRTYYSKKPNCLNCAENFSVESLNGLSEFMNPGQINLFQARLVITNTGKVDSLYMMEGLGNKGDQLVLQQFRNVKNWVPSKDASPDKFDKLSYTIYLKVGNFDHFYVYPHSISSVETSKSKYVELMALRGEIDKKAKKTLEEKRKKYEAFDDKINKKDNDIISDVSASSVAQYVFKSKNLGWINCDRIYPNAPAMLTIQQEYSENENVVIVLKNRQTVVFPRLENGLYVYDRLPHGETAIIFGFKVKEGILQMASKEFELQKLNEEYLSYAPTTYAKLENQLAKLDLNQP